MSVEQKIIVFGSIHNDFVNHHFVESKWKIMLTLVDGHVIQEPIYITMISTSNLVS